ncbi:MAG: protein of unknown function (DUF2892) [halophilic archaeon J07HB67]|nr:MAG: protein of unknown function (DUF2892) [halophilic archaeon J07HB67]
MSTRPDVSRLDSRARIAFGAVAGLLALAILVGGVGAPDRYAAYSGVAAVGLLANGPTCRCGIYRALGVSTREPIGGVSVTVRSDSSRQTTLRRLGVGVWSRRSRPVPSRRQ